MEIIRTTSKNVDFISLVAELDAYLSGVNGEDDDFFKQFNKVDTLNHVVLVYEEKEISGCGAFKLYDETTVEIKRMYVKPSHRRKGMANSILKELESWAFELGYKNTVLETAKEMKDAVSLYKNSRYQVIPNYGQYIGVETSICFKKQL